jgi:acyl carrier protein
LGLLAESLRYPNRKHPKFQSRNTRRSAYDARAMSEDIEQRVIRVIAKNKKMAPEELSPNTRFDNLKMDSLDALNMIFALEEEFDIDIPNEEAAKMKSIEDAIRGVEESLRAKSSLSN